MNTGSVEDLEDQRIQLSVQRGYSANGSTGSFRRRPNSVHPQPKRASAPSVPQYPTSQTNQKKTTREKLVLLLKPSWNTIFVTACVLAVSLDPLFFYIPIIDEEKKCLDMDVKLKNVALVLRSFFDVTFIVHIVYQIREAIKAVAEESDPNEEQAAAKSTDWVSRFFDAFEHVDAIWEKLRWRSFITNILAVLPVPQVLLVVIFFKMGGPGYLEHRKILNLFLLLQYVARIYRIYLSSEKITKSSGIWVKGLFNFFLYILASHVFGAFWYFFAIQRETSCWHRKCGRDCPSNYTFYCNRDNGTATVMQSFINGLNTTCAPDGDFGFGIFRAALESHNTESKKLVEKLFYCFWWGLRNLSNFGTNLEETSNYPWEISFAILVSVSGLLIFLYLIGNVQTYMQMQTTKAEEIRQKMIVTQRDLQSWMTRKRVPPKLQEVIIKNIKQKLEDNKDANLENLFAVLPWDTKKALKRHLCLDALKELPGLRGMDEKVLKMICDYLKPVSYTESYMFAEAGSPADHMIFITEGTMWILKTGDDSQAGKASPSAVIRKDLKKDDFYGYEQLLSWAAPGNLLDFKNLPNWTENVKCHTNVEGFALSAKDLQSVVHKCRNLWKYNNPNSH
ncbi:cyclic nucleotide-gated ion channel 1-like [Prunus avium]|uniref:Cyclic nucleotide-gated ion channel 1-like n=1 Tax=Prunus avium TaxID=42229 RepID=A0A6P5RQV1_PRUAV|nr:cyclic nucleotide-gated ion channel 1-like [Prunus avium]